MVSLDLSQHNKIDFNKWQPAIDSIHEQIEVLKDSENNFLGWIDYVEKEQAYIDYIIALGKSLQHYELMVVIGIGGSFLGAKSAYELLKNRDGDKGCELLFVGTDLSGHYLEATLELLKKKDFCVNVISKSGGTLETAIAFRFIKALLSEKYGEKANERIFITTNPNKSSLGCFGNKSGLNCLEIPENIGGRYSLFTAVGLLPLTASGVNIEAMIEGFKDGKKLYEKPLLKDNLAYQYAVARRVANMGSKEVEIFTAYEPSMCFYLEWLKQLFGESEGKEGKGIYPISVVNTRDLHSLGQFFQEGTQKHFETIIFIEEGLGLKVPNHDSNFDGLDYLAGVTIDTLNQVAMEGTRNAHHKGGIPNILIKTKGMNGRVFGQLSYFFMRACAMTCYLLGVNPFNQPGVEQYKKEVKKLLEAF
ncbi:hypothetical protein AZF37_05915 [endosymbiont 'TC1' of Trimyema compressum]|uniref:glucose-6-phosphate isomerase n=1 Tax=endosymbiont 'TC1' of Trimyema compressum TaxID=243899 RepID=UPI0007F0941E|nr:glucose-6-phosphate isomerase [endosymbiont 'TC1' of Trimyema compressum]AMP20775.1 hypothetical protein AZF37_05915 [endosymbiont 'TC1' of Trimyema compressum]